MDLKIEGRWAIVCASSQGLGRACAAALSAEGVNVVVNGRDEASLQETARALRSTARGEVVAVAADINEQAGRDTLLAGRPDPDILVFNNGGPKPGTLFEIDDLDLQAALDAHFWAPISLLRTVLPHMTAQGFGRVVTITSAMVTTPRNAMVASAGARAGQWAVLKAVARDVARHNVTINNLLPERVDSPRQMQMAHLESERSGISFDEARERQRRSIAAGRHGLPEELGAACAFLCSEQASFISGLNMHLDGGSYPALV